MTPQPKEPRKTRQTKDDAGRTRFITLRCTEDDKEMVDELSEACEQTISDLVLDALRPYCKRLKKKLEK